MEEKEWHQHVAGFLVPDDSRMTHTGMPSLSDMPRVLGGMGIPPPETLGKGYVLGPRTSTESREYEYREQDNRTLDSSPDGGRVGRESGVTSQPTSPALTPVKLLGPPPKPDLGESSMCTIDQTVTPPVEKVEDPKEEAGTSTEGVPGDAHMAVQEADQTTEAETHVLAAEPRREVQLAEPAGSSTPAEKVSAGQVEEPMAAGTVEPEPDEKFAVETPGGGVPTETAGEKGQEKGEASDYSVKTVLAEGTEVGVPYIALRSLVMG